MSGFIPIKKYLIGSADSKQLNLSRKHKPNYQEMMGMAAIDEQFTRGESSDNKSPKVVNINNARWTPPPTYTDDMRDTPTRPELDAKLETIEARMDGRLARIEDAVKRISEDNAATRASISNLKTTVMVTAVGAVLTVLFGVAAFNATLLSNMTSSFDSGRETAKLAAEAQAKSAQTQEQTARLIADAEVKAAQAQKDTAAALAEIRAIVSDLNKKQQ
ncbi:hypothetical protein QP575_10495 [Alcaligenes faecalis subsp. phenolicus]|uniref:hypothetical protein n=1 Tax=Alcaligenes nematophilus TaxID=2994643 RepID=UPI002AA3EDD8|nr:hypothetical protein [Alcaligenes phenolicus]